MNATNARASGALSTIGRLRQSRFFEWWPVILGLAALYVPAYNSVIGEFWRTGGQSQGPLVLIIAFFLVWKQRAGLRHDHTLQTRPILGAIVLGFGLIFYVVGRSQSISMFEIGSQILVLSGILLITNGTATLKSMWFPLFFLIFMIPLPGFLIDAMTVPMKIAVSYVADNVLFWAGYPIARSGVILQIGQYQLLVADACAGMYTLISLEALGLLYLHLIMHDSAVRNLTLAILIIPISFAANVIRVMILILVTYYFGDRAGQGFVHGFAGLVLFAVALLLIFGVDSGLQYFLRRRAGN